MLKDRGMPFGIVSLLLFSFTAHGNMRCVAIQHTDKPKTPVKVLIYKSKLSVERDSDIKILWDYFGTHFRQHYRIKYLGKGTPGKKNKLKTGREYECIK